MKLIQLGCALLFFFCIYMAGSAADREQAKLLAACSAPRPAK